MDARSCLDELYVTSANSRSKEHDGHKGKGNVERKDGGDLFVVRVLGYKGAERERFDGRNCKKVLEVEGSRRITIFTFVRDGVVRPQHLDMTY